ncbi:polysaccharide deacetylase family protein [Xanthobacter autotrophicus]|uniref:polysaccharide deacetylase family protein n=1 Tax=Xanthobacter TaxID=279 RepID=UPI0024AA09C1|nr:polysaccharide deacetylase family protein [Xanthobacter autotrophicus]MDI4663444.1 polysaccharide deacetylase family protein [Xanthobacter autotrophicus]
MKPLLIVSGILVASAVGAGVAISPMLTSAKAVRDDGPATTQSISQNPQGAQAKGAQGNAAHAEAVAPAPAPAPPPVVTPRKNYTYKSFNVDGNYIAMTFDDGPNPETTPQLLAILKERGIKATFFVLGNMVAKHPEVLKMIADEGHEIGSHSWSHPQLTRISQAAVEKELGNTSEAIFQVTGKRPMYLRPPYGSMKPSLRTMIEEKYGLTTVNWAVDPNDWKFRDSQKVHDAIMAQVTPGAIVLAHDIYPTTVAAMPRVLDELIAKGYKFGTISDLIAMDKTPKVQLLAALPNTGKPQQAQQKPQKPKPATASAKPDGAKPASKPAAGAAQPPRAGGVY